MKISRSAALPAFVLAALVAGCTAIPGDGSTPTRVQTAESTPGGVPTPLSTPTASPTPPAPTPTPTPTPTTETAPAQKVEAGTVADGVSAQATGTGEAEVTFRREGDLGVVVHLDCSACTGRAVVTATGRMSPWGDAPAPVKASYLADVFKDSAPDQSIIVRAEGNWVVTLESWNDLEPVQGPQSGTGSTVLFLADTAPRLTVTYAPSDADDQFFGRVFTVSDEPKIFGDSVAFTETHDVDLPGVMAISTNGTWTLTPTP